MPNQYQLITLRPGQLTRYARHYAPGRRRWIGDTRVSPTGSDWRETIPYSLADTDSAFSDGLEDQPQNAYNTEIVPDDKLSAATSQRRQENSNELLERVAEATMVSHPDARITPRPDAGYLRISVPLPGGGCDQWPVGVIGQPDPELVSSFIAEVHASFAAADPQVRSELVYAGDPVDQDLIDLARRHGVRLRSLVEYQGLIDLRPLAADQDQRIARDLRYPDALYVPQRFSLQASEDVATGLLEQVVTWLDTDGARFVMILGEFGRGKTFLLRQLARNLPSRLPAMLPVLVELHGLEKAPSLDELLAQHLVRHGMRTVELPKLRYMIERGRLALLFDGFDELALRVSYDHAADYLQTLLAAATGNAKIVLTSRTQHFQSVTQVRTALGDRVATIAGSRIAVIEDFTDAQIRQFLVNHYGGDERAAQARFDLLDQIQDLLGLSHNPRMLSFIADLGEARLREIQQQHGTISAARLYEEIIRFWLRNEAERQQYGAGLPSLDKHERRAACSALALRLWASTAPAIPLADLSAEVQATLTGLAERGYAAEEAAQAVGSGTLLVSPAEGAFTFVHPSVMEWLVADAAAERLRNGEANSVLAARRLSRLMTDFLCDLADQSDLRNWTSSVFSDTAGTEIAKLNALDIVRRLGGQTGPRTRNSTPAARLSLAGTDLRGQDLTDLDLRGADLREADLRGMRLNGIDFEGADLRGAVFTNARLIECDLTAADLTGSHWSRAALAAVTGLDELTGASALYAAGVVGRDPAEVMLATCESPTSLAMSPDSGLAVIGRGNNAEIVDLSAGQTHRVLVGHTQQVNAVAFSPDGTLIATASADGTARTWVTASGQPRTILTGHTSTVNAIAFSPDGTLIATASADGTARTWVTASGQPRTILTGHTQQVNAVAFSPDGTLIATASHDRTARTWDTASGQPRTTLTGHTRQVNAIAFSPDGTLTATASHDRTARTWDTATGQPRTTLTGHTSPVTAVAFSPDGTLLATTSAGGTARTWDTATGQPRATLTGHTSPVTAVAFSPDGTLLATTSAGGTARTWDTATGQPRATLTGHVGSDNAVNAVAFSPDGTLIATASYGTSRTWDTATGQPRTTLTGHVGSVNAVAFSPDGTLIATASYGTARTWDTATGQPRTTLTGHTSTVNAVAFSPDGTLIATASIDGTARTWDTATGRLRTTVRHRANRTTRAIAVLTRRTRDAMADVSSWLVGVAFSPDGTLIGTASADDTARTWDTATGQPRNTLTGHTSTVNAVAFSPDGTLIATASADSTARTWDTATGQPRTTLTGHTSTVNAVAFSPDGTLIATASTDRTARTWDTATGQPRTTLTGHTRQVSAVAFSPDGTLIATASDDGTVRLWDQAGISLALLRAFGDEAYAILLPDGSYKLAGDPGGELLVGSQASQVRAGRDRRIRAQHPPPVSRGPDPQAR